MDIMRGVAKLPETMRRALELDDKMKKLAQSLVDENSLLLFGRGYNYATALEGALKVKEVALLHSEGILAGEMKHGPLALVDETLPLVVIARSDSSFTKQKSVIEQLRARDARCILIVGEDDDSLDKYAASDEMLIKVPEMCDCLQPLINIIPLQLLSYHLTVFAGTMSTNREISQSPSQWSRATVDSRSDE